jgi:DNA-binding GntR family transcriptional regulator
MVWLHRHINDVRGHARRSALFTAIANRDTRGAVDFMTRHLETAGEDLPGVA